MSKGVLFLGLLALLGVVLVSYRITLAFFSDTGQSTNNTFTASTVFPTPTPTPTPGPGDVVINEVNWGGSNAPGGGSDEWVELRNTTGGSISVGNWVVVNLGTGSGPGGTITIPSGSIIPANGFFLISNKNKNNSAINVDPDFITSSVSLDNSGEQLTLKTSSPSGTTIDTANGAGVWFAGNNNTPKKSMERKTPPGDGTQAANWQTATTHTNMDGSDPTDEFGTPKATNGL